MIYDAVIVGAGVSGSFIANRLTQAGLQCVMLEAGKDFDRTTYPRTRGRRQLAALLGRRHRADQRRHASACCGRRWSAAARSSTRRCSIASTTSAFDSWREALGRRLPHPRRRSIPGTTARRAQISISTVPEEYRQRQRRGLPARLRRQRLPLRAAACAAQRDCRFEDGNCCIECLMGCRIDSKQSMPVTVLRRARAAGCELVPEFEARRVERADERRHRQRHDRDGAPASYPRQASWCSPPARSATRACCSPRASTRRLPALGHNFYTHPQYMTLGVYDRADQRAPRAAAVVQVGRSDLPPRRLQAGERLRPAGGDRHAAARLRRRAPAPHEADHALRLHRGRRARHQPGPHPRRQARRSRWSRSGSTTRTRAAATAAWRRSATSSSPPARKEIIEGNIAIGLHLMGGCNMGIDPAALGDRRRSSACTASRNIYAADSSIFPNAPGINPSFTIMALSQQGRRPDPQGRCGA